ncbi:MAG: hypothetical protein SGPRY_006744 [Prymnesium sp.]
MNVPRNDSKIQLDTASVRHERYFLVMFGMRGLYSIVLGANNDSDDTKMMQQQMGMGAQPGQQPDMNKIFGAEAENLQLVEHSWFLDGAEERMLRGNQASVKTAPRLKSE